MKDTDFDFSKLKTIWTPDISCFVSLIVFLIIHSYLHSMIGTHSEVVTVKFLPLWSNHYFCSILVTAVAFFVFYFGYLGKVAGQFCALFHLSRFAEVWTPERRHRNGWSSLYSKMFTLLRTCTHKHHLWSGQNQVGNKLTGELRHRIQVIQINT